jgi:hypothetical protein
MGSWGYIMVLIVCPAHSKDMCHASVLALLGGLKTTAQSKLLPMCTASSLVLARGRLAGHAFKAWVAPFHMNDHRFPAHLALVKHFHGILVWVVPASWAHTAFRPVAVARWAHSSPRTCHHSMLCFNGWSATRRCHQDHTTPPAPLTTQACCEWPAAAYAQCQVTCCLPRMTALDVPTGAQLLSTR